MEKREKEGTPFEHCVHAYSIYYVHPAHCEEACCCLLLGIQVIL